MAKLPVIEQLCQLWPTDRAVTEVCTRGRYLLRLDYCLYVCTPVVSYT
jgi:hypothetical protein